MPGFTVRPCRADEVEYIADAHERIYLEEYGWGEGFSKYARHIVYDFAASPKNPREEMWVAEADGKPIGSIMIVGTDERDVAKARLFLVEKQWRKNGVGSALMHTLLDKAREAGYKKIVLQTAEPLTDARSYYARLGFVMTATDVNHEWRVDGGPVTEENWELIL